MPKIEPNPTGDSNEPEVEAEPSVSSEAAIEVDSPTDAVTVDPVVAPVAASAPDVPATTVAIAAAGAPVEGEASRPGRVRRLVGRLARATLVVAVVAGITAIVYLGWPLVSERFLEPVQSNTADLSSLHADVERLQAEVERLSSVDSSVDARLADIDDRLADHERQFAALEAMDATLAGADGAGATEVARQIRLLKAMELMSRARLFLYQSNFGLAEQDLRAARGHLEALQAGGSDLSGAAVVVAFDRVERALAALPEFPVAASDDLDIAWQAVLGEVPPQETETPEPASIPETSPVP